ncbi:MAG: hypothetical protein AVDCRST_MAG70-1552 [uncultured Thermomicrobiales bacterium]|uniref:DUF402 domain-containing protein n=1 Tax=uncultured Thermomicrobiales bacterium TaxID=1645740 RepID=A0A6J4UVN2_9BACT|nr:MAG: hypothetical protein AVDCRST_MAG70-1552 [uncultured Thermomicrobiales bacterium]
MSQSERDPTVHPVPTCGPPAPGTAPARLYYRKEKLRGACWEYPIVGGWRVTGNGAERRYVLHHRFAFYRPRTVEVHTHDGTHLLERTAAHQWFFPDRWFSLLRFVTGDDQTVGYYVNFSLPLGELRRGYYRDLDLELDLWLHPDGTVVELDRDEFEDEIANRRMEPEWVEAVNRGCAAVIEAAGQTVASFGPDLDLGRDPGSGLPAFILTV